MHDLFVYITMPLGDYLVPGLPYPFLRKAWDWGKWKREWERELGRRRKEEKERMKEGGKKGEEGSGGGIYQILTPRQALPHACISLEALCNASSSNSI